MSRPPVSAGRASRKSPGYATLATQGRIVNRNRVRRLMASDAARRLGNDLSAAEHEQAGTGAQDLPLFGEISIERVNQVWCAHIIYVPIAKGFL